MKSKVKRSKWLRAFNSLCAALLMVSSVSIIAMGFSSVAVAAIAISAAGAAAPLIQSGDGILAIVIGVFEALIDGVVAAIEVLVGVISGLFS